MGDPRVFFAAERTLLAWVRSGLTLMAFGFVVARFGLFLALLHSSAQAPGAPQHSHLASAVIGIVLVLVGVGIILGALLNHHRYVRALPAEDVPNVTLPWLTSFLSFALAAVGILLAIYLGLT
ncbi:MAG TPA: DUF202 domain-containing protein [Burkholderiales bacterium]|nr:DUF202 domain-containing protein [Burkholderiales bacterium]